MSTAALEVQSIDYHVRGAPHVAVLKDLFIPEDALSLLLEEFSGPMDLLLYLIHKQNIDILDIPIAMITAQYMAYIDSMKVERIGLASEYLLMAATLMTIKSRCLLPRPVSMSEEVEEDPRLELARRLQAYEACKQRADYLEEQPWLERDCFQIFIPVSDIDHEVLPPEVALEDWLTVYRMLIKRVKEVSPHLVEAESLSVRDRMSMILLSLKSGVKLSFTHFLSFEEGKKGVIVSFLAILELARLSSIIIHQEEALSPIFIEGLNGD